MNLPHRFPFRLVDGVRDGRAVARVTVGAYWRRGGPAASPALLVEAVAQGAALLALADGRDGAALALAAVEEASWLVVPTDGQTLEVTVAVEKSLGRLVRVRGEATVDGLAAGGATLVLASG